MPARLPKKAQHCSNMAVTPSRYEPGFKLLVGGFYRDYRGILIRGLLRSYKELWPWLTSAVGNHIYNRLGS